MSLARRLVAFAGAAALSAAPVFAQGGRGAGAYQPASVADLGVQDAIKFAMQLQGEKEAGKILLVKLVWAEQQTTNAAVTYRLCLEVQRLRPPEQAIVMVRRNPQDWNDKAVTSWTDGPCPARPQTGRAGRGAQ
jgi:hypothetical protein